MCECASLDIYYALWQLRQFKMLLPTPVCQPGSSEECPFSTEKSHIINPTIVFAFVYILHTIPVQI